ncbi:MAG: hypothetical protein KC729_06435 [Candidatus Eisenbacteria bacterium]|uniref:Uncharacterized protein n=1 Tax=Eiseniibacteriota bacterium TaxID=2212470 RepID=A0A956RNP3_UNCEI|nr:hypothetical protein [Candidatus Eisenbacteria bacterium]
MTPNTNRATGLELPLRPGIEIQGPPTTGKHLGLWIQGSFLVPEEMAGGRAHRKLVLAVMSGDSNGSCAPFLETALFPDDETRSGGNVGGFFQLDVLAHSGWDHAGTYYVVCSIGPYVSEVLPVLVS